MKEDILEKHKELVSEIKQLFEHSFTGGMLHIVLEDGHISDEAIDWVLRRFCMTDSTGEYLCALAEDYNEVPSSHEDYFESQRNRRECLINALCLSVAEKLMEIPESDRAELYKIGWGVDCCEIKYRIGNDRFSVYGDLVDELREICGCGSMHIVIDDFNVEDDHIDFCLNETELLEDMVGEVPDFTEKLRRASEIQEGIARILKSMCLVERRFCVEGG